MNLRHRFVHFLDCYARKDLAGISALLAEDVSLRDWNISVRGRPAVEAATRQNFDDAAHIDIQVLHLHESPDAVAGELKITVDRSIVLYVVDVIQFDAQARVTAIRSYKGRPD